MVTLSIYAREILPHIHKNRSWVDHRRRDQKNNNCFWFISMISFDKSLGGTITSKNDIIKEDFNNHQIALLALHELNNIGIDIKSFIDIGIRV